MPRRKNLTNQRTIINNGTIINNARNKRKSILDISRIAHHFTISCSAAIAVVSIAIGLSVSFEWSYKVVGSPKYTMMLFSNLNPAVVFMLFAVIAMITVFPYLMGTVASDAVRENNIKITEFKRLPFVLIVFTALLGSLVFFITIYPIKKWPKFIPHAFYFINHLTHSWVEIINLFIFFLIGVLAIFLYNDKKRLKKLKLKLLVVPLFAVVGCVYGMITPFIEINHSSISHVTNLFLIALILLIIYFMVIAMLLIGMMSGSDPSEAFPYFAFILLIVSVVLLIYNVPQKAIMSINNGIAMVPEQLDSGITRAIWRDGDSTKKSYYQCAYNTMYIIKKGDNTLFSCISEVINGKNKTIKNNMYRGVILNNVSHKIIYAAIADNKYTQLSYNINCIRRIDGHFLCARELLVPHNSNKPTADGS